MRVGEFLYESLVQKYGFAKFAKQKFKQTVGGIMKYRNENARVRLFSKFMGICDDSNPLDDVDFDFYIKALDYMKNQ